MADAGGFRWTTPRVAALYPFALLLWLPRALAWQVLIPLLPPPRNPPVIAAMVGLLTTGACALAFTRTFDLEWPVVAVALVSYAAGSLVAAAIFGYVELVRSEFPDRS